MEITKKKETENFKTATRDPQTKKISIVISEKQKSIQSSSSSIGYRIEL